MAKEKQCLITTSLVSAVQWYLDAPDMIIKPEKGGDGKTTWKTRAYEDLERQLSRTFGEMPDPVKWGLEFEKKVYSIVAQGVQAGSDRFQKICAEMTGFKFGQKQGINETIAGEPCYLYVKFDGVDYENKRIRDLKTVSAYTPGKYIKGFQHALYCHVSQCTDFRYLIAEWEQYPKIAGVYTEDYHVDDFGELKKTVHREIERCLTSLKDLGLWELYRDKFCLY